MDTNSLQNSSSAQTSHSRCDSTWSNLSEASLSTSPNSDSASLLEFRCDTPVMTSRRSGSPSPSIRSYYMAEPDEDELEPYSAQSSVVMPDITSLSNSLCPSDSAERDCAMEELRNIVRSAILAVEADDGGPLGLAELHAAARDISCARRSSDEGPRTPLTTVQAFTPPSQSTPPPCSNYPKTGTPDMKVLKSAIGTPPVQTTAIPCCPSPQSPSGSDHPSNSHLPPAPAPATPRSRPGKLYKPRPVFPDDPIPLQTFRTISSPSPPSSPTLAPSSSLDQCRSQTPRAPESPTWSHGLLKPFGLRLDVHMLTDAISGLGIRKPVSPPNLRGLSSPAIDAGLPRVPSPVDSPIDEHESSESPTETTRARMMKRWSSGGSEWQYLRHQSGDTDDTPVLATPIDEWYLPQLTPATEFSDWKDAGGSK
jgi:hypothetical protein